MRLEGITTLLISLSLFATSSCKYKGNGDFEHPVLKVDLTEEQDVSVFDIFKSVEIIPLETSQQSLFSHVNKIEVYEDKIFCFDVVGNQLLTFDSKGRFINKIHKVGRGPGEYMYVYDFALNGKDENVTLLNPMGSILTYDLNGTFIKEDKLPTPPLNYQKIDILNDDTYITYSLTWSEDEPGVNILNAKTMEIEHGFFPLTDIGLNVGSVFYKSGGDLYYQVGLSNKVYHMDRDGYKVAYEWDTGMSIIDQKELTNLYYTTNEGRDELFEKYEKGEIPFIFLRALQSKDYYFTSLQYGSMRQKWKYIFYNKESGRSLFFEDTTEGIDLTITYMTEDYAMGILFHNNTEGLQKVVSPEDAELLRNRKEDDNWWLVKYTFK